MKLESNTRSRPAHVVQFYPDDDDLVVSVSGYLIDGLREGGVGLVIATPGHLATLRDSVVPCGEIVFLDAAESLSGFMIDGRPDPELFDRKIGDALRALANKNRRVYAFGEMVAVLWEEGNVTGALELEELWNGLLDEVEFSLFCAYPNSIVADDQGTPLAEVCALHSDVVGAHMPRARQEAVASVRLPSSVESPRRARRFVNSMLAHWGLARLTPEASLIVTELSTNAVLHGKGDLVLTLTCRPGSVRIDIEDESDVYPERAWRPGAVDGRGLILVDAVASRWGVTGADTGKVVWAELRNPEPAL
jgi:hypothetical protein